MASAAVIRQTSAAALIYSTIAQSVVQDAVASPPRRLSCRVRKCSSTSRGRGRRRSSRSPGPDEEFSYGSGGSDGVDGGDGGDGGSGGGSSWDGHGDGFSWWWWRDEGLRQAILSFFHQVACCVCLFHCLHFLGKSVVRLSQGGDLYGPGQTTTAVLSH